MKFAIVDGDRSIMEATAAEGFWDEVVRRIGERVILRSHADVVIVLNPIEAALSAARFFAPDAKIIAIFLEEPADGVEWAYKAGADLTTVYSTNPDEAEKMLRELLGISA
jgi:hypothetical protein